MKKLFAAVLSVITALTVASGALAAFTWNAAPGDTPESFAARYKIEVVKLANESGAIGSTKLIEAPAAVAANQAPSIFTSASPLPARRMISRMRMPFKRTRGRMFPSQRCAIFLPA